MKKLIALLGIMLLCTACPKEFIDNNWVWAIFNHTEQTLKFRYPSYETSRYNTDILLPDRDRGIGIYGSGTRPKIKMKFNDYFNKIVSLHGNNVYWQILSENNVVLKTWTYSEKNLPDQRFFKESSWSYRQWNGSDGPSHTWIFTIEPSDIVSE